MRILWIVSLIATISLAACGGGQDNTSSSSNGPGNPPVSDTNSPSRPSLLVAQRAEAGQSQYAYVEFVVQSYWTPIFEQYKAEQEAAGVLYTPQGFYNLPAYQQLLQEYEAVREDVFPNYKLGEAQVQTFSYGQPAVVVQIPDYASLMQILAHPKVKAIYASEEHYRVPPAPYVPDPRCLRPNAPCIVPQ